MTRRPRTHDPGSGTAGPSPVWWSGPCQGGWLHNPVEIKKKMRISYVLLIHKMNVIPSNDQLN